MGKLMLNDRCYTGSDNLLVLNDEGYSGGRIANLIEKTITDNGIYSASDDGADGYSEVTVDVASESSKQISYLKWRINDTRSNPANSALQLSEFYLYLNNVLYNWNSNVSITASLSSISASESIEKIIDGNVDTKYVTIGWGGSYVGQCDIVIALGETITVDNNTSYAYATGDDEPSRDPVGWTLFGSIDGSNWFVLDARDSVNVPTARKTSTERFSISVGGGGGIAYNLLYSLDQSQGGAWVNTDITASDYDKFVFINSVNGANQYTTAIAVSDIAVYAGGADVYTIIFSASQIGKDFNARIYNDKLYISYNGTGASTNVVGVYEEISGGLQLHTILTAGVISNDVDYQTATFTDSIGANDNYLLMRMLKDGTYRYMSLAKSDIPASGEYAFTFSDVQCAISQTTIRSTYYSGNWRYIYVDIIGSNSLIFPQSE